jgi:hypothetical protein
MSPEEEALAQARNMHKGMMGFGSMQPPKTDSDLKNFFIQALLQGPMAIRAGGVGNSPTTNMNSRALAVSNGVNRGPNMYNPIKTNLNLTGKPANANANLNPFFKDVPIQEGHPNPPTANQLARQADMADYLMGRNPFHQKGGNVMHADMYGTLPEANLNPGWRHPEMPEPFYGPNIAKGDKFDAAWIQQQLKQKGHDPSKMTYDQMLKAMYEEPK